MLRWVPDWIKEGWPFVVWWIVLLLAFPWIGRGFVAYLRWAWPQ